MTYADTDFIVALFKREDRFHANAQKYYAKHKKELWTSPTTLIELLFLSLKNSLDPEALLLYVTRAVEVRSTDTPTYLYAAHLMKTEQITPMDALHAAFCGNDPILSSDAVFDRVGLERIPLEKSA